MLQENNKNKDSENRLLLGSSSEGTTGASLGVTDRPPSPPLVREEWSLGTDRSVQARTRVLVQSVSTNVLSLSLLVVKGSRADWNCHSSPSKSPGVTGNLLDVRSRVSSVAREPPVPPLLYDEVPGRVVGYGHGPDTPPSSLSYYFHFGSSTRILQGSDSRGVS